MKAAVSVTFPVGQAIERVRQLLFRPFDLGRWFVIGFCAWLAHLGEQGFGSNFNFGRRYWGGDHGSISEDYEQARDYVMHNLHWIVPLAAAALVLLLAIGVVFTWLQSRGKFMFLHCVALDKAEVAVPWHRFRREGLSLFWFQLVLGSIAAVVLLPLVALIVVLILGMIRRGEPDAAALVAAVGLALGALALGVVFAVIRMLTTDAVVPIMFLRGKSCLEAWDELRRLLAANVERFVLYVAFRFLLLIATVMLVLLAVLLTCCIAGCVLVIPYLGTVLLLPVLVFKRAYSSYYLAQYGSEFDVFAVSGQP